MLVIPLILAALFVVAVAAALGVARAERSGLKEVLDRRRSARESGSHAARLEHPWIDRSRCIGCGSCVRACPEGGVLDVIHGQAAIVQGSRCVGHGRCAEECPVGAISLTFGDRSRRDDLPALSADQEAVGQDGLFLAGELTGYALVQNAVQQGTRAVAEVARQLNGSSGSDDELDLLIVGAGPAGLAASLEAKRLGLRTLTLERDSLGGTVARYPRRKMLMTRSLEMPLGGRLEGRAYSKEELMQLWQDLAQQHDLPIREQVRVQSVLGSIEQGYTASTDAGAFRARRVLLALGRRGVPRQLGVPGEELLKVSYSLIDAQAYRGRRILVVGGGDSAVEAALGLAAQPGNQVHLSYRREKFFRLRARNEMRVLQAIEDGRIVACLGTELVSISEQQVELKQVDHDSVETLANDEVFLLLGGEPPFPMLEQAGVSFNPEDQPAVAAPAERGAGLRNALAVAAFVALGLAGVWWWGLDYYAAEPLVRREHTAHAWLHSSRGFGVAAGVVAVSMMLANLAYLLRRAAWFPWSWGKLRSWMNVHVATGLLALLFAAFHATFTPLDTPGGRAFWGLVLLVATGALGRYLYSFVPRAANGRELAYEEARQRLVETTEVWQEVHREFGEQARDAIALLLDSARWRAGRFGAVWSVLNARRQLRDCIRKLRVRGIVAGLDRQALAEVLAVAERAHRDALAAAHFEDLRRLLAAWRYFHRWVSLLVVGLVALHIWAGWRYADLGVRG